MARLSDIQLGAVRHQLEYVLTLIPGPAPAPAAGPDARRRWCRDGWGVQSLDEVGKSWAAAVNALGTTLYVVGLAERVRRDRPATPSTFVLQDLNRTAEYSHAVLCLAVDVAEGRAVMQRRRSGLPVPEAEAERAAEQGVEGWQVADVLTNLLHVDKATFRRFLDDLRCRVETVLAEAGADGEGAGPPPATSSPPTSAARLRAALADLRQLHDDLVRRGRPGAPPLPEADLARLWALDSQVELLAARHGIARPDAGRPSANWQERGWTRICYHHSTKGLRVVGGTNWDAGMDRLEALAALAEADSAAQLVVAGMERRADGDVGSTREIAEVQAPPTAPAIEIDRETQAIALLVKRPELSIAQIADHLQVSRATPYRWKKFKEVAALQGKLKPRGAKDRGPRRGHKTRDGQVEAYDNGDDDE